MSVSKSYDSDMQIYAPHGSIFIFRRAFFEHGGNIRFPYFLFGEEIYIAEQVKEKGGKILYAPELNIIHNEHTSTGLFKWGRKFDAIRQTRNNMKSLYHY
jgi:GT2 family glycosyltransferase